MRGLTLTVLLFAAWVSPVYGDGVTATAEGGQITITNTGRATLVGLKVGQGEVLILKPKARAQVTSGGEPSVHGRIELAEWHLALDDLSAVWAPFHLRTSGFLLDALDSGPLGDPAQAANLKALRRGAPDTMKNWVAGPDLRLALVARAARHAPPALLARLMSARRPDDGAALSEWPPAYAGLESITDSIRAAIEQHGAHPDVLRALAKHPDWAADRGLGHRGLLSSLASGHSAVKTVGVIPPKDSQVSALVQALDQGREAEASRLAVDSALVNGPSTGALLERLTCAGLDSGARAAIKVERWLAAEAYLRLAGEICGDRISHRGRVAEFFRRRGDVMVQALDLAAALDWFRAALWFGGDRQDRARLADTHAELAILGFRSMNPVSAQEHLDQANHYGPYRPRVVTASELKPRADPRARFGLIIIIIFVAFFALRRLARLFADRRTRPRLD